MAVAITRTADPAGAGTGTTITYSAQAIGTADDSRMVVVCVGTELTSGTPTSATLNYGAGAITMTAGTLGTLGVMGARVFWLWAPTGTTADIAVTFGASQGSTTHHLCVYSVTGADPESFGAATSTDMDATAPLTTGARTIATGGGFIGIAACADDLTGKTWANATEDLDEDAGTFRFTTATRVTALSATAVTCTGATNGEDGALAWIIFRAGTTVKFVSRTVVTSNGGTIVWPNGTLAGDHGLLLLFGNGSTAHTGSGWTTDVANSAFDTGPTTFWSAHSKLSLSSAEIATPFTFSNTTDGGYILVIYRSGTGISFKTSTTDLVGAGTTNTLTGFTKAATSNRVVSAIVNRNDAPVTIGLPAGFNNRVQGTTTFFTCDAVDIDATSYTNNATVVWTALEASGDGAGLWEITTAAAFTYFGMVQPEMAWLLRKPDMVGY